MITRETAINALKNVVGNKTRLQSFMQRFYREQAQLFWGGGRDMTYQEAIDIILRDHMNPQFLSNLDNFSQQFPQLSDAVKGLYEKFHVIRRDGRDISPQAKYIVLRVDDLDAFGVAARAAVTLYAKMIQTSAPQFSKDLLELVNRYDSSTHSLNTLAKIRNELFDALEVVEGKDWLQNVLNLLLTTKAS